MTTASDNFRTLGKSSAAFISEMGRQGIVIFTLDEAEAIYNKSRPLTTKFLADLVNRGVIARIKSGVYIILKVGQENTQLTQWPLIAQAMAGTNVYYISHYSAMRLHGMTMHPLLDVYVTMTKQQQPRELQNINYHFVYCPKKHFWGEIPVWVSKHDRVCVSSLERTLLDAFDRPQLCGGVHEIARGIWLKRSDIDWLQLIEISARYKNKAAVKRLGFMIELLGIAPEKTTTSLLELCDDSKCYALLDPQGDKAGRYIKRWWLHLNINIDELKEVGWS